MSHKQLDGNRVRRKRQDRGWSQEELAQRAGISRTAVSAVEGERLVPSVAAALALSHALECTVEELFGETKPRQPAAWAWSPAKLPCRYWLAEVQGRVLAYPAEATARGELPHDGVARSGSPPPLEGDPARTLVIAGCDPAAALLAAEFERSSRFRLLPVMRSSRRALALLQEGLVHVAGIHLAPTSSPAGHADLVGRELGPGYRLLRFGEWEEGVALAPGGRRRSIRSLLQSKLRWVGREAGSGARQCLDELFATPPVVRRFASDHRGVAAAIQSGWADAGVCLRLASDEAGLDFHPVRWESYDLCFPAPLENDPRIRALTSLVRDSGFRRLLGDLPGYDVRTSGELASV
jgi:molybdate-binding protein/transcriptional regulator with XRE-family HTH domain